MREKRERLGNGRQMVVRQKSDRGNNRQVVALADEEQVSSPCIGGDDQQVQLVAARQSQRL